MAKKKTIKKKNPKFFIKEKKKLTFDQEFQIMKLVLDKFLWLGFAIMAFGMYMIIIDSNYIFKGISFMIVGVIILVLFMMLLIKEYEIIK